MSAGAVKARITGRKAVVASIGASSVMVYTMVACSDGMMRCLLGVVWSVRQSRRLDTPTRWIAGREAAHYTLAVLPDCFTRSAMAKVKGKKSLA
jgi:hypothetical protein